MLSREALLQMLGTVILSLSCTASLGADARWAGYLVDRSCADNFKSQGMADLVQLHTRDCALNEGCSRNGYAIYSKGQWYQLDARGSDLARGLLKSTSTSSGHFVVVSGTLDKSQIKVSSIKELAQDK